MENYYNYQEMENEIGLKLLMLKRVQEPTLWQVQQRTKAGTPSSQAAWLSNSHAHPGLPEHFLTQLAIDISGVSVAKLDDLPLPVLPYPVNREIQLKIVVIPVEKHSEKIPSLSDLSNGSITITGQPFVLRDKHNVEIFLSLHGKLLPCYYCAKIQEIITKSPFTENGRVRCYYAPEPGASPGISFTSSKSKTLHKISSYRVKFMPGTTPYPSLPID